MSAIRYPRDNVPEKNFEEVIDPSLKSAAGQEWQAGRSRVLREGSDATVIVYGALAETAMSAAVELANDSIDVEIIDARFVSRWMRKWFRALCARVIRC